MYKLTTRDNGLKVITRPMDGTKSLTLLVLVGAGSRYETKEINGISHFLEHLFFKGGERYKNASEVSSAIDSVGGDFNAFTGKEYAGYFVKLAAHQKHVAFDVIGDMMMNASFQAEEIDKERGVILEEYNMYQDTPMYQVGWNFEKLLFGDQPLGWDQIGEKDIIKSLTREQFIEYKKSLYTPENTVITVAGSIDDTEAQKLIDQYFGFARSEKNRDYIPYQKLPQEDRVILQEKKTEQAHLILGAEGLPARHEDEYAAKILSVILGGNMSSRMFLNVREGKGLCYYIRTTTDDYMDAGTFSTSAGIDLNRIDLAIEAILEEYQKIQNEFVSEAELKKAKEFMKGKIILRVEDSEEMAHMLGKQALLYPSVFSLEDIMNKIEAVTAEDVHRVANDLLKEESLRLAVIGPYSDQKHFADLLKY